MLVAKYASEYKPPGSDPVSLSDQRAVKAQEWVEKEVDKLMKNIVALAKKNPQTGNLEVTFGELFYTYQDISDTLVGIMVRAKKRGFIEYEGQGGHMLFQGRHDKVVVTVTKAGEAVANGKAVSSPPPPVSSSSKPLSATQSLPTKPSVSAAKPVQKAASTPAVASSSSSSPSNNTASSTNSTEQSSGAASIAMTGLAIVVGFVSSVVDGLKKDKGASS